MIVKLKERWTVKHWREVVIMALLVALVVDKLGPVVALYVPRVEAVSYHAPCGLDCEIERRAVEIYEGRKLIHLEQARLEAIQEYGAELVRLSEVSPFVNYDKVREIVDNME